MNKKIQITIFIIIILLILAIIGVYIYKQTSKLSLTLSTSSIKVNIYEEIDLTKYLVSAKDSKGNDITDKVKIKISADKKDEINNNTILINSFGEKTVIYRVYYKGNLVEKKLTISVISNPYDKDYRPNYSSNDENMNTDDEPVTDNINDSFNDTQKEYLESLLK